MVRVLIHVAVVPLIIGIVFWLFDRWSQRKIERLNEEIRAEFRELCRLKAKIWENEKHMDELEIKRRTDEWMERYKNMYEEIHKNQN
jgi:hypothetical protein